MYDRHFVFTTHLLQFTASVDPPQTPANLENPSPDKAHQSRSITGSHESNQDVIVASPRSQQLSRNRHAGQAAEAHDRVQPRIPSPKHFGVAQLSHADRGKTDVASRGEAEEDAKDDQLSDTPASVFRRIGEPHREDGDETQSHCDDHRIEPSEQVSHVAWRPSAEEGPRIEDGEKLVAESRRNTPGKSVRGDVGERYEESPLDKKDPQSYQREDSVLEDAPIGPDVSDDLAVLGCL